MAHDKTYEWFLSHAAATLTGTVNEKSIILIIARDTSLDEHQYFGVFEIEHNRNVRIALARLEMHDSNSDGYSLEIKNNSIYLTTNYIHHGVYNHRYQFKDVSGKLKLVGYEALSGELFHAFAGVDNYMKLCSKNAKCPEYVYSGTSYNYLSSTSICWAEFISEGSIYPEPRGSNRYQPRGIQHKMSFAKSELQLLDGFDEDKFVLPKSCYFDFKKKLHVEATMP